MPQSDVQVTVVPFDATLTQELLTVGLVHGHDFRRGMDVADKVVHSAVQDDEQRLLKHAEQLVKPVQVIKRV